MNADELMRWYLRESGYQPKPGESMKGFMPDWIGRFYALYQWMEKKSSRDGLTVSFWLVDEYAPL